MLVSATLGCLACEAGLRIASGVPVFQEANFRNKRVIQVLMSRLSAYDPLLGWTIVPRFESAGFNTLEYGIRRNGPETTLRTGGTLVVGSSFAAGSGIADDETWPAALERLTGTPVLNAAVGGYSIDQIALRAEQLFPVLRPRTLVVEAMDASIRWNGYSSRSRPKPYFTVEDGRLIRHNVPVPTFAASGHETSRLRDVLGHSLVIDHVMAKLAPETWFAASQAVTTRVQTDEVEVSCKLLDRLKALAERHDARLLLLAHPSAQEVVGRDAPPDQLQLVTECAAAAGIQVAATFPAFKALWQADPDGFRKYFITHGDVYGHMSAQGTQEIAKVLAAALARPVEAGSRDVAAALPGPGSGPPQGLIPASEPLGRLLPSNGLCTTEDVTGRTDSPPALRISPIGSGSAHYVGMGPVQAGAGTLTFSFEVRPENVPVIKAQLYQGENAVIAEFDLERLTTLTTRLGKSRHLSAGVEATAGGWFRVRASGTFPGGATTMLVQVHGADGADQFTPRGESIVIRRVQLEQRGMASVSQADAGR